MIGRRLTIQMLVLSNFRSEQRLYFAVADWVSGALSNHIFMLSDGFTSA